MRSLPTTRGLLELGTNIVETVAVLALSKLAFNWDTLSAVLNALFSHLPNPFCILI